MGATKTLLFTKQQNDLANMAKALAHPARIAILEWPRAELDFVAGFDRR